MKHTIIEKNTKFAKSNQVKLKNVKILPDLTKNKTLLRNATQGAI